MFLNLKCTHAQKTGGKFILGYQQQEMITNNTTI